MERPQIVVTFCSIFDHFRVEAGWEGICRTPPEFSGWVLKFWAVHANDLIEGR